MTPVLLVPLDDTVVFPTMDVTLPVDVGDEERVLLIPRHGSEFAKVGTIAEVTDRVRLPGGGATPPARARVPRGRRGDPRAARRRRPRRRLPALDQGDGRPRRHDRL